MKILYCYLVIINLIAFCLMAEDKRRAKRHLWRIPERTLFSVAILGGSIGGILGMYLCRHKTKHWYFVIGMPLIFLLQAGAGWWLFTARI